MRVQLAARALRGQIAAARRTAPPGGEAAAACDHSASVRLTWACNGAWRVCRCVHRGRPGGAGAAGCGGCVVFAHRVWLLLCQLCSQAASALAVFCALQPPAAEGSFAVWLVVVVACIRVSQQPVASGCAAAFGRCGLAVSVVVCARVLAWACVATAASPGSRLSMPSVDDATAAAWAKRQAGRRALTVCSCQCDDCVACFGGTPRIGTHARWSRSRVSLKAQQAQHCCNGRFRPAARTWTTARPASQRCIALLPLCTRTAASLDA